MMIFKDILEYHCLLHLRPKSDKFHFISGTNNYENWNENIFLLIQNFNTMERRDTTVYLSYDDPKILDKIALKEFFILKR